MKRFLFTAVSVFGQPNVVKFITECRPGEVFMAIEEKHDDSGYNLTAAVNALACRPGYHPYYTNNLTKKKTYVEGLAVAESLEKATELIASNGVYSSEKSLRDTMSNLDGLNDIADEVFEFELDQDED